MTLRGTKKARVLSALGHIENQTRARSPYDVPQISTIGQSKVAEAYHLPRTADKIPGAVHSESRRRHMEWV